MLTSFQVSKQSLDFTEQQLDNLQIFVKENYSTIVKKSRFDDLTAHR